MKKQTHQNQSSLGVVLFVFVLLVCIGLAVCFGMHWEPLTALAIALLPALVYILITRKLQKSLTVQQTANVSASQTMPQPSPRTTPAPPPALEETAASAPRPLELSGSREQWRAKVEAARQTEERIQQARQREEEARKRAEEEARRQAEEEARKRAEEEARKRAEEEARRRAEEEARRRAEEEARRRAEEEARKRAEEEARKRAEEEAQRQAEHNEELSAVLEHIGKVDPDSYVRVLRKNKTLTQEELQRRKQRQSSAVSAPQAASASTPAQAPSTTSAAPVAAQEPAPAAVPKRREVSAEDNKVRDFLLNAAPGEAYRSDCCIAAGSMKDVMKSFQSMTAVLQQAPQLFEGRLPLPYAFPIQTEDGKPLALTPLYLMPLTVPEQADDYRLIRWDEGLQAQAKDGKLLLTTPQGVCPLPLATGAAPETTARLMNSHIQLLSSKKYMRTTTLLMSYS